MSQILEGRALLSGVAVGYAHIVHTPQYYAPRYTIRPHQLEKEKLRLLDAVKRASHDLMQIAKRTENQEAKQIIDVHMFMVNDVDLLERVNTYIVEQLCNAEWAVQKVIEEYISVLQKSDNKAFKAREQDIHDSSSRILRHLYIGEEEIINEEYSDNTILVANILFSSQFLSFAKDKIKGLVLCEGDETSHLAILAESYNIPLITGISNATEIIREGDKLILNSIDNRVIVDPDKEQLDSAELRYEELLSEKKSRLLRVADEAHLTRDGQALKIHVNIFSQKDIHKDLLPVIDGVGLFRTEFLFKNFSSLNNEDFQIDNYGQVLQKLNGKAMTIRTLDVGGDKTVFNFLSERHDTSPLGVRGVRFSLLYPEQFAKQLFCILKATAMHATNAVRILFPMVSQYDELMQILDIYRAQVKKVDMGEKESLVELGFMLEVPSSAYLLERLPPEFSFVSLGTNDLLQFFLAAERGKHTQSYLNSWLSPLFLRFLGEIVYKAGLHKVDISICGEIASDQVSQIFLLGAGLRQFSVKISKVAQTISTMRTLAVSDCRDIFEKAILCNTSQEVQTLIKETKLI